MSSEITLTNNEIKDIKVIRSLKNRAISLKGTTGEIISQEGGLLGNYLVPLMRFGLLLMKSLLTRLAKSVLIPLGLTAADVSNRCSYLNENLWIRHDYIDNFKQRNNKYYKNSLIS